MTTDERGTKATGTGEAMAIAGRSAEGARMVGPESFKAMFDRYSRPVLGFLYGMLGDLSSAEEAMQETFVRAYRNMASVRGDSALSTWIFGIARNVVREELRSRRRGGRMVGLDDADVLSLADGRTGPDVSLADVEAFRAIRSALAALTEDQRTVFVLKVLRQMQYTDISSVTGASVAKLKTDLHRARAALRERLSPLFQPRAAESRGGP